MSRRVDLTNCDREPIHIPGSIQPHGCLLACDSTAVTVLRHSANAPEMLGIPGLANGALVTALLGDTAAHDLRNALTTAPDSGRPAMLIDFPIETGRRFDVAVHRFRSTVILEFEPASRAASPLHRAREMIGRIAGIEDVDRMIARAARLTQATLGYDRVMVYRFDADGSGQVISEVKRDDLESFLGQYFPAADIPQQARSLYLRNSLRIISDASNPRVPIIPELDASGEPLDLSFAHLRSVSPIHCEYLRNMGVAASMSVSIIVDGKLWGLIACHHYAPRVLPMAERVAAELFGQFFSLHLHALQQKRSLDSATSARRVLDRFLRLASHHAELGELFRENLDAFASLVPCDGVGVWIEGAWHGAGSTPPADAIPALARFLGTVADGRVWATHALSLHHPAADVYHAEASGVLAVPLSQIPRDYLFFFRKELVQTLDWAGNPEKSYESGQLGDRLTPRKSFAVWKEAVERQSRPWTEVEREVAEATRSATVEIALRHKELMAEERDKSDFRQRMLNEELNHRVKNILAVIKSLVGHPVRAGRSLEDYVTALRGRIQALAYAHDQVVRGDGGGTLADLLNAELGPYRGQGATVDLDGPGIWLDSRAFSVMALMLHELATNAAKYGALSRPRGRVAIVWRLTDTGDVELSWQEAGGPLVRAPSRTGFGTALIDRSVPFDLGGETHIDYRPEGLVARVRLPAKHVAAGQPAVAGPGERPAADPAARLLPPDLDILLLEDQMLIAMDAEAMLAEAGLTRVAIVSTVAEARSRLRRTPPDVAILDVNLGQGTSIEFAEDLLRRGIPFVFATGYGNGAHIPAVFAAIPVVRKPYDGHDLAAALARVIAPA